MRVTVIVGGLQFYSLTYPKRIHENSANVCAHFHQLCYVDLIMYTFYTRATLMEIRDKIVKQTPC